MSDNTFSAEEFRVIFERAKRWNRRLVGAVTSAVFVDAAILAAFIWWGVSVSTLIVVATCLVVLDIGGLLAVVHFQTVGHLLLIGQLVERMEKRGRS